MVFEWIRVSEGTGAVLELINRKLSARPTTAYLMTYNEGGCGANCAFCPQARSSDSDPEKLSRVSWPRENFEDLLDALSDSWTGFGRICVQAVNYSAVVEDIIEMVPKLRDFSDIPISVCCQPLEDEDLERLSEAGVTRICIPVDAATAELFDQVKGRAIGGPYRWEEQMGALKRAKEIFDGRVTTHLMVGLGETELEMIRRIQFFKNREITVGLFAFTPIRGTKLENRGRPSVSSYRKIQLARYLIFSGDAEFDRMQFDSGDLKDFNISSEELRSAILSKEPFLTSGCVDCNRPYYNETPSGPIYNFPEDLDGDQLGRILRSLKPDKAEVFKY